MNHFLLIRCYSCFLCPMCSSQLCGLVDETTSSWEWTCFACNWKSSLKAPTLLELKCWIFGISKIVAISNQQIQQSQNSELNVLKSAAECVRFELGLSEPSQPSPYSMPYTHSKQLNSQVHQEQLDDIRRQQEKILSQFDNEAPTLPFHPSLRAKRIVKCLSCNQDGSSGLLFKAQGQPLLGDSSLFCCLFRINCRVKGHDSWFRVASLGLYSVPQFSIIQHDDDHIMLRIRNVPFVYWLQLACFGPLVLYYGRYQSNDCWGGTSLSCIVIPCSCELCSSLIWWNYWYVWIVVFRFSWLWATENCEQ